MVDLHQLETTHSTEYNRLKTSDNTIIVLSLTLIKKGYIMFGDILFAMIPFATFDDGESPESYAQQWINQCPSDDDWDNQDPNKLPTAECKGVH